MATHTLEDLINRPSYPSQFAFHQSNAVELALIGAVGCGKTDALVEKGIMLSWSQPGNEGLIGRQHEEELERTTMRQFFERCPDELIIDFQKKQKLLRMKTTDVAKESVIWFRHVGQSKPGVDPFKNMNLGWAAIDQAEDCQERTWNDLKSRLRRSAVKHHQLFGIANAAGRNWMWKRFVDAAIKDGKTERLMVPGKIGGEMVEVPSERYAVGSRFCIVAQTAENLSLPDNYIPDKIENNPPNWVQRFIYSTFEEWAGKCYHEYNEFSVHNIDPFPIPGHWPVVVAIDVGGDAPWGVVVLRHDPDGGDIFVTNEFYKPTVLIGDVANWLKNPLLSGIPDWKNPKTRFVCDPENKQVIFELHAQHRIVCEAARKGPKVPGIMLVAGKLHPRTGRVKFVSLPGGTRKFLGNDAPYLWVFKTCVNWRREHNQWTWKRNPRTDEVFSRQQPVDKEDHLCDGTIYGVKVVPSFGAVSEVDQEMEELKKLDWRSYQEASRRLKGMHGDPKAGTLAEVYATAGVGGSEEARKGGPLPW